jgi:RNAse (barnase) inhibitor barstar
MTDVNAIKIRIVSGMDNQGTQYWSFDDVSKLKVKTKYHNIYNQLKHGNVTEICTTEGVIKCIKKSSCADIFKNKDWSNFSQKYIKHIHMKSVYYNNGLEVDGFFKLIDNIFTNIKNENIRIESKYDKKFNDLFENTSDIINELKQDLNNKHEKIRELELKVHYLESQIEKKVTIDYDAIKKRNKNLNNEFKRVAKLMKLG